MDELKNGKKYIRIVAGIALFALIFIASCPAQIFAGELRAPSAAYVSHSEDQIEEREQRSHEIRVFPDVPAWARYFCGKVLFAVAESGAAGVNRKEGTTDHPGITEDSVVLYRDESYMLVQTFYGSAMEIYTAKTDSTEWLQSYRIESGEQEDTARWLLKVEKNPWIEGIYNGGGGLYRLEPEGQLIQLTDCAAWDVREVKDGSYLFISESHRYPLGDPYQTGDRVILLSSDRRMTELLCWEGHLMEFTRVQEGRGEKEEPLEEIFPLQLTEHIRGYGMLNYDDAFYELTSPGRLQVVDFQPGSGESAVERDLGWLNNRLEESGLLHQK